MHAEGVRGGLGHDDVVGFGGVLILQMVGSHDVVIQ
jgi:hypothetical protein